MPRTSKPALRSWSDLSARERSPRDFHDRAKDRAVDVVYVLDPAKIAAVVNEGGTPSDDVGQVLKIWILWPRDGHGEQGVRVVAFQRDEQTEARWYADGGTDPTSALAGCPVLAAGADVVLGGHCDPLGRPKLRDLATARGWMILGSMGT